MPGGYSGYEEVQGGAGPIDKHPGPVALEYRWTFAPDLTASGRARRRLDPIMDEWGLSGQESHNVLLVMNELVTNAVEHARTPLVLLVSFTGSTVLIEVSDGSLDEPRLQPHDPGAPRGRGLQFVDALAHSWGWTVNGNGKTVRAEMAAVDHNGRTRGHAYYT